MIAFFDVIEHVRNTLEFMQRVNRRTKKSGNIYCDTIIGQLVRKTVGQPLDGI